MANTEKRARARVVRVRAGKPNGSVTYQYNRSVTNDATNYRTIFVAFRREQTEIDLVRPGTAQRSADPHDVVPGEERARHTVYVGRYAVGASRRP